MACRYARARDCFARQDIDGLCRVQDARRRIAREGRKRLMVRLMVLAIVVAACVYFGPTVVNIIKGRATQQAAELQEAGDYLKEGRDRRSGANFDSTE